MCREAGVIVTDDAGRPFDSFAGMERSAIGPTVVAAGPGIHARILAGLSRRGG